MEAVILILILATIFVIVARRIPSVSKEINEMGEDFFDKNKEEEQKMNKVDLSDETMMKKARRPKKTIAEKTKKKVDGGAGERLTIQDVVDRAGEMIDNKEYADAEKMLIASLEIDPRNPKIYNKLGIIYLEQENYADAKESFKAALKYDKNNDLFYNNLGLSLFNQGRYLEAIEAYQRSIQLNSLIPHRYINVGLSFAALRQYEKALDAYKKALVLDKDNENYQKLIREAQEKIEEAKMNS